MTPGFTKTLYGMIMINDLSRIMSGHANIPVSQSVYGGVTASPRQIRPGCHMYCQFKINMMHLYHCCVEQHNPPFSTIDLYSHILIFRDGWSPWISASPETLMLTWGIDLRLKTKDDFEQLHQIAQTRTEWQELHRTIAETV